MEEPYVYYGYSTPEQREQGLIALRKCLIRDGWIKEEQSEDDEDSDESGIWDFDYDNE